MRDSTTIHQAILYKKPVILLKIKTNERGGTTNAVISLLSKLTGANVINLEKFNYANNNFKLKHYLKINENKYTKYKRNYIKPATSPNAPVWTTVLNELKKINTYKMQN